MTASNPALLPDPPLFDVTGIAKKTVEGTIERFPLDEIELAPNARREISSDGIERLAGLLTRAGQLVPCIGYRPDRVGPATVYEGQRRYLAAKRSHELAGTEGYEGLEPVHSLIVLLLDHEPSAEEIRRIQAIANNAREALTVADQQNQFADCWLARAGLDEEDRIAAVCADLGIGPKKAHNLRRQLTLPSADPRPGRRAAGRRAAVGDDGQQARGHARDRPGADRGRRRADHQPGAARQGAQGPRRVRAPNGARGRAHLRACGSTTERCSTATSRSSRRART